LVLTWEPLVLVREDTHEVRTSHNEIEDSCNEVPWLVIEALGVQLDAIKHLEISSEPLVSNLIGLFER
jgi:hypothetical protein